MSDSQALHQSAPARWAVAWSEIHADADRLAAILGGLGPWRGVVAVTRGGMIPAGLIARILDIRLFDTFCAKSYDGETAGEMHVLGNPDRAVADDGGRGWLVIDDLVDTGGTARAVRRILPNAHLATLYIKPLGRGLADSHVREVAQDCWIDFPWELPAG